MENKKIKIVALFGKSGSGKDTLQKALLKKLQNSKEIISDTTRPKRDYEQNGIDYNFISIEDFTKKVLNKEMLEATTFNDWFYGTPLSSLDENKINIGVFNPEGINCLWGDDRLLVLPFFIDADDKTRMLRQLNREKNPNCHEICRRYFTDEQDFHDNNYDFDYYTIDNNGEEPNIERIISIIAYDNFTIGQD